MKLYHVELQVLTNAEGISHEEALAEHASTGEGFCDGLFVASIAYRPDGPSVAFYSFDGCVEEGKLTGGAMFYVWARMAERLASSTVLAVNRRKLCKAVWEWVQSSVTGLKEIIPSPQYHLRFNLKAHPDGICVHEAEAREVYAASDAMIVAALDFKSIPFELNFTSRCGHTDKDVADDVWWATWVFLSADILRNYEPPQPAAEVLNWVINTAVHIVNPNPHGKD